VAGWPAAAALGDGRPRTWSAGSSSDARAAIAKIRRWPITLIDAILDAPRIYRRAPRRKALLMSNQNEMNALADRLTRAYEENDTAGIVACYAPDAQIWHNLDEVDQSVDQQLDATRWLNEKVKDLNYEILSRDFFDGGYVQQYIVHGTVADSGADFHMSLCMHVTVRNGQIARLAEYLDSANLAPLGPLA
jgi:ketosteroid isomerase-like protein